MGVELRNTLKENRLEANLTQEELADKIGVTRQTIISIEKGVYAPSVTLALLLSKTLKKHVEDTFSIKK